MHPVHYFAHMDYKVGNVPGQNSNEWLDLNLDLFIVVTCRVVYNDIFCELIWFTIFLLYYTALLHSSLFVILKASEEVFTFLSLAHARIRIIRAVLFNRVSVGYRS